MSLQMWAAVLAPLVIAAYAIGRIHGMMGRAMPDDWAETNVRRLTDAKQPVTHDE